MAYKLALAVTLALTLLDSTAFAHPHAQPHSNIDLFSRSNPGINCDGSSQCAGYKDGDLSEILAKVNAIEKGKTFNSGDNLACAGNHMFDNSYGHQLSVGGGHGTSGDGVCAMIGHNTPSFTVGDSTNGQSNSAADVIQDLIYHGCKACGTAPTVRTGNNLGNGCIVVNYVEHVCYYSDSNPCGH